MLTVRPESPLQTACFTAVRPAVRPLRFLRSQRPHVPGSSFRQRRQILLFLCYISVFSSVPTKETALSVTFRGKGCFFAFFIRFNYTDSNFKLKIICLYILLHRKYFLQGVFLPYAAENRGKKLTLRPRRTFPQPRQFRRLPRRLPRRPPPLRQQPERLRR